MKQLVAGLALLAAVLMDRQALGDVTSWNIRFGCRDGGVVVAETCWLGGSVGCGMFSQGTEVYGFADAGAQEAAVAHVAAVECTGTYCPAPGPGQCFDAGEYPYPGPCQNALSHGTVMTAEGALDRPCSELSLFDTLCFFFTGPFPYQPGTKPCGRLETGEGDAAILQGCPMPDAGSTPVPSYCVDAGSDVSSSAPDAAVASPASESSGGCSLGTTRVSVSLAFVGAFLLSLWAARRSGKAR